MQAFGSIEHVEAWALASRTGLGYEVTLASASWLLTRPRLWISGTPGLEFQARAVTIIFELDPPSTPGRFIPPANAPPRRQVRLPPRHKEPLLPTSTAYPPCRPTHRRERTVALPREPPHRRYSTASGSTFMASCSSRRSARPGPQQPPLPVAQKPAKCSCLTKAPTAVPTSWSSPMWRSSRGLARPGAGCGPGRDGRATRS